MRMRLIGLAFAFGSVKGAALDAGSSTTPEPASPVSRRHGAE